MPTLIQRAFATIAYVSLIICGTQTNIVCMEKEESTTPILYQRVIPTLMQLCLKPCAKLLTQQDLNLDQLELPAKLDAHLAKEIIDLALIHSMQSKYTSYNRTDECCATTPLFLCPTASMKSCYMLSAEDNDRLTYITRCCSTQAKYSIAAQGTKIVACDTAPGAMWTAEIHKIKDRVELRISQEPFGWNSLAYKGIIENATNHKIIFLNNNTFVLKADEKLFSYHIVGSAKKLKIKLSHQQITLNDITDPWAQEYLTRDEHTIPTQCAHMVYTAAGHKPFFNTNCLHDLDIKQKLSEHCAQQGENSTLLWQYACDPENNTHFYLKQNSQETGSYNVSIADFQPDEELIKSLNDINKIYMNNPSTASLCTHALSIYHATTTKKTNDLYNPVLTNIGEEQPLIQNTPISVLDWEYTK